MIYYVHNKIGVNSVPVSLEINGETYYYPQDKLFVKLKPYIGQEITVFYQRGGIFHHKKTYTIGSIEENAEGICEVEFKDKN